MKKAYELSILCNCEVAVIIFSNSNKLYQYASSDIDEILLKYSDHDEPYESINSDEILLVIKTFFFCHNDLFDVANMMFDLRFSEVENKRSTNFYAEFFGKWLHPS